MLSETIYMFALKTNALAGALLLKRHHPRFANIVTIVGRGTGFKVLKHVKRNTDEPEAAVKPARRSSRLSQRARPSSSVSFNLCCSNDCGSVHDFGPVTAAPNTRLVRARYKGGRQ